MARVPKKVADRFATTVGAFQRVLADAKDRDVNESDTVTIITDILSDVLGYNKYSDITSEQAIRGTYCDLAVKHDGKVQFLIEVKGMCCNFQKEAGERWVGSSRRRLMQPPRTAC